MSEKEKAEPQARLIEYEADTTHADIVIAGTKIQFPHTPYTIQSDYM